MVEMNSSSGMTTVPSASEEVSVSSSGNQTIAPPIVPIKRKRNLPGMPDPDAEVIALSPKTLLATNRFVCEICNKGFQRDQNLQLHRRGHNLPWKLRQRNGKEVKKRVYVCPEPNCVHHDPSRALGDLTGIKKHFCRKHGEKKWKCERCSKKYAVMSDWKAHMKTCGTREYRCDCGTLFSRRDSFITHRAFCDALAQESAKSQSLTITNEEGTLKVQAATTTPSSSPPPHPLTPSTGVVSPVLSIQSSELPENQNGRAQLQQVSAQLPTTTSTSGAAVCGSSSPASSANVSSSAGVFTSSTLRASGTAGLTQSSQTPPSFSSLLCAMGGPEHGTVEPVSLSLSSSIYLSNNGPSLFPTTTSHDHTRHYAANAVQPALSATALLQKAAQIGATTSGSSLLRGLGLAMPPPKSSELQDSNPSTTNTSNGSTTKWLSHVKPENNSVPAAPAGLGLGLPSDASSVVTNLMMGPATIFGCGKPTTLDFLGLGMGPDGAAPEGFSAYLNSMGGGGLEVAASSFGDVNIAGNSWDDSSDRKPSLL